MSSQKITVVGLAALTLLTSIAVSQQPNEPAELRELAAKRNAAIDRVNRTYAEQIELLQNEFTREGRLDAALLARKRREQVLKELHTNVLSASWKTKVHTPVGSGKGDKFKINLDNDPIKVIKIHSVTTNGVLGISISSDNREFEDAGNSDGTETIFTLADGERITAIEVRAGLKVLAIRIITNSRSSSWIGGSVGSIETLKIPEGHVLTGFSGTTGKASTSQGETVLTSLGVITKGQ